MTDATPDRYHRSLRAAVFFLVPALWFGAASAVAAAGAAGGAADARDSGATAVNHGQQRRLLARSARASLTARDRCQRLMHEDAIEFRHCADGLLRDASEGTVEQRYAKLGVAYYAWLAATAAAKNGLPIADATARHFLPVFRSLQQRLAISDDAVCATIPGDCAARNARMHLMEQDSGSNPAPVRSPDG